MNNTMNRSLGCDAMKENLGIAAERYWEARWRDEKAENERLEKALFRIIGVLAPIDNGNHVATVGTAREIARAAIFKETK